VSVATVSPARAVAYRVVRRVFEEGAYADRALSGEAERAGLDARDRALAMRLAYGAVQRARTLDHMAERLTGRPAEQLDPATRTGLRLGLLQLHFLDVADHAAVSEAVELVKTDSPGGARLVNAVLRRAAREQAPRLPDGTAREAALAHSVPDWLAELWWAELGPEEARQLLRTVNEPPEHALRANTLVPHDLCAIPATPAAEPPEALVLTGPWDAFGSSEWRAGAVHPQSRASMLAARALAPEPGERVLDLCAAPGGKATHLAALMAGRGEVVAVERHPGRAEALRRTAERLRADTVRVVTADATAFTADAPFDRVLVDPPCSGLGTLQSRPDLRWRASPEQIAQLAGLQERILAAGERALKPGGTLVYSVCTISAAEVPDRPWTWSRRLLPHRDGTEGFALARLGDVAA
jgi:16S rRNA (cytosine967-C5)-methyltransferase